MEGGNILRKIIISDIHGFIKEFKSLLQRIQFNIHEDTLYLLGDYVDKGKNSREVVQYVQSLSLYPNVEVIGGNHDNMFLSWLDNQDYRLNPYTNERNGGEATLKSFCPFYIKGENEEETRQFILSQYPKEIEFLRNLPFYIEDEQHIYVHAGIDPKKGNWKETSEKDFRWIRKKFIEPPHSHAKTVIFGHTSCAVLHQEENNFSVWFHEKKIGIDGGIKFGGQLNALLIENEEYKVVSVPQLKR